MSEKELVQEEKLPIELNWRDEKKTEKEKETSNAIIIDMCIKEESGNSERYF